MFLHIFLAGSLQSHHVIKDAYGATWLKLFYHNSVGSIYFANRNEALYTIGTSKYSILSTLNTSFIVNGAYEFLLEYPNVPGYNRWRQNLRPMDNPDVTGSVASGYSPIHIDWNEMYWGGLVLSSQSSTLLDGSCHTSHFWYSIGETSKTYSPGYPGPYPNIVTQCYLWVRIDGSQIRYPIITKSKNSFIPIIVLLSQFIL